MAQGLHIAPHSYFTLTQQYYNCCSLDGRFYYRDADSQNSGSNIGYLKWVASDTEDPTDLGDTVTLRSPFAKASGFGQIVPVSCKLWKICISWGNSANYNTGQALYTMVGTPPNDANATDDWTITARDIWLITGPGCDENVFGHSSEIACNNGALAHSDNLAGHWVEGTYNSTASSAFQYNEQPILSDNPYFWDGMLDAGDHIGLGIYSHQTHLGQPSVTGSVTWFFEVHGEEMF